MALLKCPECGKENVSDTAISCPDCGFSIQQYLKTKQDEKYIQKEKERLQSELAKKLSEIDSLQKPQKPTISKVMASDNRWVFVICAIMAVFGLAILIYSIAATGKANGFLVVVTIFCIIMMFVGLSDIKETYKKQLSEYQDFDGFKENQKKRIQENYDYRIKNIKPKTTQKETVYPDTAQKGTYIPAGIRSSLKCPACGSYYVKRISTTSRVASIAMVGLASSKIGKQYECKNCKHKW